MSTTGEVAPRVVAVAGGKGGSGKSLLAANIGIFLATLGKQVVLVDAALGSANAHTFCGVTRPTRSLGEALLDPELPLRELLHPTPVSGLQLIAGAGDPAWVADPSTDQVRHVMRALRDLVANYVIVDLSAGTSNHVIDMFLRADIGVVVAVPEPTSVELCYRFIRAAFTRLLRAREIADAAELTLGDQQFVGGVPSPLDMYLAARERDQDLAAELEEAILNFRPHLVINGARSKADMELGPAVTSAARRRLGITVQYLGHLEYDEAVWVAVRRRQPLLVEHPESRVSRCIEKVTRGLLATTNAHPAPTNVVSGDTYYDLLDVAPTASFEDIRRANRRMRDIYGTESVVMAGLYSEARLAEVHRTMDIAYNTLMDATRRKEYDHGLFPDGVPYAQHMGPEAVTNRADEPPVERPPMPKLSPQTAYTGALLQQIREARGVDLREISERTKIGMGYLSALETETFAKLPAVVYVRGFLVEYAKILDLDIKDLLKSYLARYKVARAALDAADEGW